MQQPQNEVTDHSKIVKYYENYFLVNSHWTTLSWHHPVGVSVSYTVRMRVRVRHRAMVKVRVRVWGTVKVGVRKRGTVKVTV